MCIVYIIHHYYNNKYLVLGIYYTGKYVIWTI